MNIVSNETKTIIQNSIDRLRRDVRNLAGDPSRTSRAKKISSLRNQWLGIYIMITTNYNTFTPADDNPYYIQLCEIRNELGRAR